MSYHTMRIARSIEMTVMKEQSHLPIIVGDPFARQRVRAVVRHREEVQRVFG